MRSNALSPMVMVCTDRSSRGMDFDRAEVGHNEKPGNAAEQRNVSHDEAVRVQQSAVISVNLISLTSNVNSVQLYMILYTNTMERIALMVRLNNFVPACQP